MTTQFDCINEVIIDKISQIGIELINDKNDKGLGSFLPKAIYEITKDSSRINNKNTKK